MKRIKFLSILVIVCLLTLTGCEFGKKGSSKPADERLESALIKLAKADSFTVDVNATGEEEGQKFNEGLTFKAVKNKKSYDLYLGAKGNNSAENIYMEVYLLSNKDKMDLYLSFEEDKWSHISLNSSDVSNTTDVDVEKYSDGIDEDEIKELVKKFKKIKSGKTNKGVTKIIATIDKEDISTGFGTADKDVDITFLVDKNDNLVGIEVDLTDNVNIKLEISKINDTKITISDDIKDNADEIEAEELFTFIMMLLGGYQTPEPIIDPEPDNDYDQVLSCITKDQEATEKEDVNIYYKDGVISDFEMTVEFTDEDDADTYYELFSNVYEDYEDFMIVKYDNIIKISGKSFVEEFEDMAIDELKKSLEEDGAACEIK